MEAFIPSGSLTNSYNSVVFGTMQAIILAAGKGVRMGKLTELLPKPLIPVCGKPALEHTLCSLPESITEVVLVIGYLGNQIREYFGDAYNEKKITYVEQGDLNGTGGAVYAARDVLRASFIVIHGDDLYLPVDLQKLADSSDWAVLVTEVAELGSAGKAVIDSDRVLNILEKESHTGGPGYANAGGYRLDERYFTLKPVVRPESTEIGLPQTLIQAASDIAIRPIMAGQIIRLTSPEDIPKAEAALGCGAHS
jgi:UDP-N-acetylglucosamine diphosphorylase / glucose-1-phosphate thymidylyltransferase / UDP-N-acetylgalactosamine diphosphorylase / glucosamine-1-phosphate N-acetyltransferase / galactosamine-1-phosphate N-acetyltransferase